MVTIKIKFECLLQKCLPLMTTRIFVLMIISKLYRYNLRSETIFLPTLV